MSAYPSLLRASLLALSIGCLCIVSVPSLSFAMECDGMQIWKVIGHHKARRLVLFHRTIQKGSCPEIAILQWHLPTGRFIRTHQIINKKEAIRLSMPSVSKVQCQKTRARKWKNLSVLLKRKGFTLLKKETFLKKSGPERFLYRRSILSLRCKPSSDELWETCALVARYSNQRSTIVASFLQRSRSALARTRIDQAYLTPFGHHIVFFERDPCGALNLQTASTERIR